MLSRFFGLISEKLGRTLLIALAGQLFFLVSVITMIPLRMAKNPVENYNLFYMPLLAILFLVLFYRACVEKKESRGYIYGYFAALVSWPLIGEVASMPVDKGLVTQFTSMNIKLLGGYFYVITGWVMLKILWRTKALKSSVLVFMMTFLSIWSFELYMQLRRDVAVMHEIGQVTQQPRGPIRGRCNPLDAVAGRGRLLDLILCHFAQAANGRHGVVDVMHHPAGHLGKKVCLAPFEKLTLQIAALPYYRVKVLDPPKHKDRQSPNSVGDHPQDGIELSKPLKSGRYRQGIRKIQQVRTCTHRNNRHHAQD